MALLTIDWPTQVITIPTTALTLSSGVNYTYAVEDFFADLLQTFATEEAMPFVIGYTNQAPVVVGSITLARVLQAVNGYTWTFEDAEINVEITSGNTNVFDVLNKNNVNVFSANSAGLISSPEITLIRKILQNRKVLSDGTTNNLIIYDDDDVTPLLTFSVTDETSAAISLGAGDPAEQSRGS